MVGGSDGSAMFGIFAAVLIANVVCMVGLGLGLWRQSRKDKAREAKSLPPVTPSGTIHEEWHMLDSFPVKGVDAPDIAKVATVRQPTRATSWEQIRRDAEKESEGGR